MITLDDFTKKLQDSNSRFTDEELRLVFNFRRIIFAQNRFDVILASCALDASENDRYKNLVSWLDGCNNINPDKCGEFINYIEKNLGKAEFAKLMAYDNCVIFTAYAARSNNNALALTLLSKIEALGNKDVISGIIAAEKKSDNWRTSGLAAALHNGDIEYTSRLLRVVRNMGGNEAVAELLRNSEYLFTNAIMVEESFSSLKEIAIEAGGIELLQELALKMPVKHNTFYADQQMQGARRVKAFLQELNDPEFTRKFKNLIRFGMLEAKIPFGSELPYEDGALTSYLNSVQLSREEAWLSIFSSDNMAKKLLPRLTKEDWELFLQDLRSFSDDARSRLLAENNYSVLDAMINGGLTSVFDDIKTFVDNAVLKDMIVANRNRIFLEIAAHGSKETMSSFLNLARAVRGDKQTIDLIRWSGNISVYSASKAGNAGTLEAIFEHAKELGGQTLLDELKGNLHKAQAEEGQNLVAPDDSGAILKKRNNAVIPIHTSNGYTQYVYAGQYSSKTYFANAQAYYLQNPWKIHGEDTLANQAAWMRDTSNVAPHVQLTCVRPKYFDLEIYNYSRARLRELVDLVYYEVDLNKPVERTHHFGFRRGEGYDDLLASIENYSFKLAEVFTNNRQVDAHIVKLMETALITSTDFDGTELQGWLLLPPIDLEKDDKKPGIWDKEKWAELIDQHGMGIARYLPSAPIITELCEKQKCALPETPADMTALFFGKQSEKFGFCFLPGVLENIITPGTPSFQFTSGLTFGLETAYFGIDERENYLRKLTAEVQPKWRIEYDRGIRVLNVYGGTQSASPILDNSNLEQFERAMQLPKICGAWVNSSGAVHVHVGIKNNFSEEAGLEFAKQFQINYMLLEKDLAFLDNRLMHNYEDIFRVNQLEMVSVMKGILAAPSVDAIQYVVRPDAYKEISPTRLTRQRAKVNMNAYYEHGTVEVRHHPATVEPAEIMAWLKFIDRFSAITKEISANGPRLPLPEDVQKLRAAVADFKTERGNLGIIDDINIPIYKRAMNSNRSTIKVDGTACYTLSAA